MLCFTVAGAMLIGGVVVACTGGEGLQEGERRW
jgi:hypothetical protein